MFYLVPVPKQFVDFSGVPYSGGFVTVYVHGTTDKAQIYAEADSGVLLHNPCHLDSNGAWKCFVPADTPLDYIVQDRDGNVVASYANIVMPMIDAAVTKGYVDLQDQLRDKNFAADYDATQAYSVVGTYVIHEGRLYKSAVVIDEPEEWNVDHWTECNVTDELNAKIAAEAQSRTLADSALSATISAEISRAQAAEAAAKTEVVQGENCTIEKTTAADGHDVYTVNADGKPQVQADWNQADSSAVDYIKNKPNLALKENVANKSQSIDPTSTTEYPSSKAVADFVNSSVATNTATFLGNFKLPDLGLTYPATEVQIAAALNSHTWPTGFPTNNDYVYVEIQDPQSTIDDKVQRYKYRDVLASWGYEYTLNNSSFTAEEKAAIDSGITSQDVTNLRADHTTLGTHIADTSNPHNVTKSQVGLGNVDNTSDANKPVSTAQQTALNAKQDTISDLTTIRSGASAGATALQPSGNGSNLSVTPDGTSTGYDLGSSTTLKAFAQKFKNLVGALKALAFKDKASYDDLSSGVQSSLDKADTALQSHQSVTDNNPTLAWEATSKVGTVGSTDLRVTMPANPATSKQRNQLAIYGNTDKYIKLFRVYKFTAGSSIGTTVELIGRAGGSAVRVVINIKGSITADYIQFYDYAGDTSHYFTLYVAQDPDNSSRNLVYAFIAQYGSLYVNAADTSAGDTDIDFSVFGDVISGRISGDTAITLRNMRDASWINSGTFDAARIPTSLPNTSIGGNAATATHFGSYGVWSTWAIGAYNAERPYARIAEITLDNISTDNNGASQMFQIEFGNTDVVRFRLDFRTSNSTVTRANVIILESTWSRSGLNNRLYVTYFKYNNDNKLAIRIYVRFYNLWEIFRIRQLDAQTGDNGYINWNAAGLYSGNGSDIDSPAGNSANVIYNIVYTNNASVGNSTTPVYVDSNGQVQSCTPSQMSVGNATKWDGHAISIGTVSSSAGTISIV